MTETYEVDFGALGKVEGRLPHGACLSEVLTIENSPLLFGCRTGICGTCIARVDAKGGTLPPPTEDEKDVLSLLCPNEPKARLACQIKLSADLTIEPIKLTRD
ncbi:MAG: (2Fe-2S)-binding protein [Elusimicrobia bacterium]|nr:(2Fe-2S)-binding protein [Elusimicrobiota bacterium]